MNAIFETTIDVALLDGETLDDVVAYLTESFGVTVTVDPAGGCPGGPTLMITATRRAQLDNVLRWYDA
jgi:hypothetical protein